MSDIISTVAVVVDPAFGERLAELALRMPVWAADTPVNRAVVERLWCAAPPGPYAVTTFRVALSGDPAVWGADVLGAVVEHHGPHAQAPPVAAVEIVGAEPTPELRAAFAAHGFPRVTGTAAGCRGSAA